jgi:uncharacterized protein YdeI (YjbR/CyaY-like superfamily)
LAKGKPRFFATPEKFREWLAANHETAVELIVGYHRKGTGKPSMTWPESVDEALCFGWIDGIRRTIDETSYSIRFTPRRKGSVWSAVNIGRVKVLTEAGRMHANGLAAFAPVAAGRAKTYSYKRLAAELDDECKTRFRKNLKAWSFFEKQPPSYRKLISWWVTSAKKEETRLTRLERLIAASAEGKRLR